ncbi:MAG TPA: hypothetical protein EYN63_08395 [Candidatus Lambdaproteobacteria bacterium]|jgi:hypothetical protein|uniref:Uncharacterized protein n=1 Tax=SAR324 cluster bacterium TaxID=2024889 RepID=A0A432GWN7_9DELT|nr:MAG: hypothetical protein DSY97_07685 [SAR324 cluster bacterium]HBD28477.1 hypothetical protein [Deltaproteobacteria bacterium]HHZ87086.1 hypothetical protein [Candidatus Lambdaproteobacteria bacterium]RTZ81995.1 MAG: hypothetical protein DSY96_10575 [SAR324 cluster bacterium]RTZ82466.1 MAG: hypothetical protein DSY98_01050 [SAR324 cluster bacterium]
MHGLLKAIIWVLIIFAVVTLPAYIWSKLDRESYENFLLHSVSPLSQKSRNNILQQRYQNPIP